MVQLVPGFYLVLVYSDDIYSHVPSALSHHWKGVFNLQAAHRELVLCALPLILSMLSLKTSIEGRPVQFGQSYYHRILHDTPGYRGVAHYHMFNIL